MKAYIAKVSEIALRLEESQSFFAVPVELDESLAKLMLKREKENKEIQLYLRSVVAQYSTNSGADLSKVEVPVCLQEEVQSAEQPSKKATAPRSKKKSPTKRKKTASSSTTSPATDESSG